MPSLIDRKVSTLYLLIMQPFGRGAAFNPVPLITAHKTFSLSELPAGLPPEAPPLEKFHAENIRNLSGICRRVLDEAQVVISYVDENRDLAKAQGVEALTAELSGIIEGGRLQALQDHLDYALAQNKGADLTLENLSRLNRAERLLSESNRALTLSVGRPARMQGATLSGGGMAQAGSGMDTVLVVAIIGLSVVGIAASVLAVLALTRD